MKTPTIVDRLPRRHCRTISVMPDRNPPAPDEIAVAFGRALRLVRKSPPKMIQARLAREADLSRNYIGMVEHGLRSPTIRTLVQLAEALDVRPWKIVKQMEDLLSKQNRPARRPPSGPARTARPGSMRRGKV